MIVTLEKETWSIYKITLIKFIESPVTNKCMKVENLNQSKDSLH